MKVEEFDYQLPEELIAQKPLPKRDESRLMVLNPKKEKIEENIFKFKPFVEYKDKFKTILEDKNIDKHILITRCPASGCRWK